MSPLAATPRYAPGHIVYGEDGTLRAVPFDLDRLVVTGDPIPVLEGVITHNSGATHFSVGRDGSLVYITGEAGRQAQRTLTWVDRNGEEEPIGLPPRAYNQPQLSPDGHRIAVDTPDGDNDVFLYDLDAQVEDSSRSRPTLWTSGPCGAPDGSRILFSSNRHGGAPDLYVKPLTAVARRSVCQQISLPLLRVPTGWTMERRWYLEGRTFTSCDLAQTRNLKRFSRLTPPKRFLPCPRTVGGSRISRTSLARNRSTCGRFQMSAAGGNA